MKPPTLLLSTALALAVVALVGQAKDDDVDISGGLKADDPSGVGFDQAIRRNNASLFTDGQQIFRYATFGDEAFWGEALKLHLALAGQKNGGVGPGVSPRTVLAVGLKVDVRALPLSLGTDLRAGKVNLDNPAEYLQSL